MGADDTVPRDGALLRLTAIRKTFPGVTALDNVDFDVRSGEIHAIVGMNGAGKSTLVNILGGSVVPDEGTIYWDGMPVNLHPPQRSLDLGIAVVHQEFSLFPHLDVATNICISRLSSRPKGWLISDRALRSLSREMLKKVGLQHIKPEKVVGSLNPCEQQLVEIARALSVGAQLLILDEPTSSLPEPEVNMLFENLKILKQHGIAIIFVTHHLDEVLRISDRVTVFRNGKKISTSRIDQTDQSSLVSLILGKSASDQYAYDDKPHLRGEAFRVEDLWVRRKIRGVSFTLHHGEIVGLAGLLGAGRTETARAIFGIDKRNAGTIWIEQRKVRIKHSCDAIRQGLGFITEDRRREGLLLQKPIVDSVVMAVLHRLASRFGFIRRAREVQTAELRAQELRIAAPSVRRKVATLSGGNQQKVVLGKWLETRPSIFILDEPTRGIDVGTKAEFYKLISRLAADGAAILLITEDIMELATLCHRVLIMRQGHIYSELNGDHITSQNIVLAINGDYKI